MTAQRLFLFDDQLLDNLPILRDLAYRSKWSPVLRRFLREATDVVRVRLAEQDPRILKSPESSVYVGLCTGLLPAAAAAVTVDTSQLLQYALEIVAISFHLSHEIVLRSRRIETEVGSWSYTVIGISQEEVQPILQKFNHTQDLPSHKYAYISAFSSTWCTISGPPSVLARLWGSSTPVGQAPKVGLPAAAAAHASHLPCLDEFIILSSSENFLATPIPTSARIPSPCNGHDSRHQPKPHGSSSNFPQNLNGFQDAKEVGLLTFGPTAHAAPMQAALEENKLRVKFIHSIKDAAPQRSKRDGTGQVAVIGMSGRYPGSESLQDFWKSLQAGKDLHYEIPPSRFDLREHFDHSGKLRNTTATPFGCFLDNPGLFDNRLFNVSPREAIQMDPLQRLILMTSYEALEMAGYGQRSPSTASNRISTYIGQVTDDWRSINERQGIDIYYIPGITRAFASGRVNYHFNWEGASYSLDSACASSSTAISLACSALLARDCDTAVAGGGSILAAPRDYAGLSKGGFLSPTGNCKTFQDSTDGYCRGEGVGVVVLKRLEDAIMENDNIQGVISGWSRTFSAKAASITQPHAATQANLYDKVLEQACLSPQDVGYVEMHGTGTQIGDSIEMESVADVFGDGRSQNNPLIVGAVKANVGHGEAAAGVTSFIKIIMMLRERSIPPQPGMPFKINHRYPPLAKMHIRIADRNLPFDPPIGGDGKRRVLLNNFDASGGNTSLIIEDPPPRTVREGQDPRPYQIVVCSARTSNSLIENQRRLCAFLGAHPQTRLSDVSYTSTARRMHHVMRQSYCAKTVDDLLQQLEGNLSKSPSMFTEPPKSAPKAVFTFTGQGSISAGMGRQLFDSCPRFRNTLLSHQKICDSQNLPHVLDIFTDPGIDLTSMSTVQMQLAITMFEVGLADLLMSWGIRPTLLIGHSLGEYAAMCVSGVLSITDTLHLVGKRSTLLQERCLPGAYAMLAVGCAMEQVKSMLSTSQYDSCQIACINAPKKTVVSGPIDDLSLLKSLMQSKRIHTTFLKTTYGFHSSQVDPISHDFESSAKVVNFARPTIPIASTLMAGTIVHDKGVFSPAYLARHAREAVNFAGALQACEAAGLIDSNTLWFEVGPEPVNLGLIRNTLDVPSRSLLPTIKSGEDNWKTLSHAISTAYSSAFTVDWTEYHKEYVSALNLLELPSYAFDLKNYWASYDNGTVSDAPPKENTPPASIPGSFKPSTNLQRLLQRSTKSEHEMSAVFSSSLTEPALLASIQGHLVDGTALCPASVFCDMAFAAAKHIFAISDSDSGMQTMMLKNLEITHPLIGSGGEASEQSLEIKVVRAHGSELAKVFFSSKATGSSISQDHGSCSVRLSEDATLNAKRDTSSQEAKTRLDSLVMAAKTGQQLRLPKLIIYKLFANLVDYKPAYQGIDEVYLDSSCRDAAASVRLKDNQSTGTFHCNPYWLDAVIHLAGFVLNGDMTKPEEIAYISTGFGALYVYEPLKPDTDYLVFSTMRDEDKKGVSLGDVYVFRGKQLVAVCADMIFQKMSKTVLRTILGKSEVPVKSKSSKSEQWADEKASSSPSRSSDDFTSTAATSLSSEGMPQIGETILDSVASETGYSREDMGPSASFADMGVDSLMSIAIVSAVKDRTGVELPSSFFLEHPTVGKVTEELEAADETSGSASEPRSSDSGIHEDNEPAATIESSPSDPDNANPIPKNVVQPPTDLSSFTSRCVLVRGRASSEAAPLFLITDGAGSAAAYIHIPPLPSGGRIYALESPFLCSPAKFTGSVSEVSKVYKAALQKMQPSGPYFLGGWSAGAVYAYEIARQLLDQGEKVQGLVIIDMRVPKPMPDGMPATMGLIEEAGLLLGHKRAGQPVSSVSETTKRHLLETVKALMVYEPVPMDPSRRPANTCVIWAKKGLKEREGEPMELTEEEGKYFGNVMEDPKTGLKGWFYAARTNFGPNGWDGLVGDVDVHTIDGDHFSIVVPPHVKVLGQLLRRFMERSVAKGR